MSRILGIVTAVLTLTAPALAREGVQVSTVCLAGSGEVTLSYAGVWRDSCIPRNPSIQIVGNRLELHATSVGGICLTVLTPTRSPRPPAACATAYTRPSRSST